MALGTAGAAGALVVASSGGGEEEVVQQVQTATPDATTAVITTPSPALGESPTPSALAQPTTSTPATASVTTTPAPAPEGFTTYLHGGGQRSAPALSFAYPAAWFVSGGGEPPEGAVGLTIILTPWDPRTAPGRGGIQSGSMKVDIYADPTLNSEGLCPPKDSTPTTLAGEPAWTMTSTIERDPEVEARVVAADRAGYRYCIIGYLADAPDPTILDRIVESFRFIE